MTDLAALACLWVVAAATTALLPLRLQKVVGIGLLAAALWLIGRLARELGWIPAAAGGLVLVATFRRPLLAIWRRLAGGGAAP